MGDGGSGHGLGRGRRVTGGAGGGVGGGRNNRQAGAKGGVGGGGALKSDREGPGEQVPPRLRLCVRVRACACVCEGGGDPGEAPMAPS